MTIKSICRLFWLTLSVCFLGCGDGSGGVTPANELEAADQDTARGCPLKKGARFDVAEHTVQDTIICRYSNGETETYGPKCETVGDNWETIIEGETGIWVECRVSWGKCTFSCTDEPAS